MSGRPVTAQPRAWGSLLLRLVTTLVVVLGTSARARAQETPHVDPVVPGAPVVTIPPVRSAPQRPLPTRPSGERPRLTAEDVLPARVTTVEIRRSGGLWTTQRLVVLRELGFDDGDRVSPRAWETGNRRLWNTQLFTRVDSWLEQRGDDLVAVFDLTERWTLIPALEARYGGRATWLITGLTEHNLLGRYLGADLLYEYFDGEHGGQIGIRNPRLFDQRLELRAMAGRAMRPRPDFVVRRAIVQGSLHALALDDTLRYGVGFAAFDDGFLQPIEDDSPFNANLPPKMQTVQMEPSLRIGRIDARRIQYDGQTLEVRPHLSATLRDDVITPYTGVVSELLAFRRLWRFTFAARLKAAVQTGTAGAQLDYWLGGLDTIRGFRDNFVRANTYALANAEVRFVVFDTDWLACEAAVFLDASGSRARRGDRAGTLSGGPGIRFFIPRFVASELRIDFPYVMAGGPRGFDLAIGTEPFF